MNTENNMESKFLSRSPGPVKMTGGRFIAETFKAYGVTHVFFVEVILMNGLVEMEELGIQRVMTHSENAAAYMADGYARASRRPGVCMAQSVGAANMAAGLQDAFLALSPVIAITGCKPALDLLRNAYQEIPHHPVFETVTKYNVGVDTIEQLPHMLRQAFREVTSATVRPVHLDLMGLVGQTIDFATAELEVIAEKSFTCLPSNRPGPEDRYVQEAAKVLEKAERPVIVAGGGVAASGAGPEIVRLAEKMSIPVATSLRAKGAIPENHPLSLGVVGSYSRWCANQIVSEADLVLFVGSHTGDQVTNYWKVPKAGTAVIQIDTDPAELGRSYPNTVGILGDAKITLSRLIDCVDGKRDDEHWPKVAQSRVKEWRDEQDPLGRSDATPIRPERLCRELSMALPSDAILVSDTGHAGIWTGTLVDIIHPEQTYIPAAGSLGWGLPAAMGAKCAAPERPVICFTGDGGAWYHLTELETAVRCGINTVTVINNNHMLSQCEDDILKVYGKRSGQSGEIYRFNKVDFVELAEGMGCLGIRVEAPDEISSALEQALAADRPAVVDVVTDINCNPPSIWE